MPAKAQRSSQPERRKSQSLRLRSVTPTLTANDLQVSLA